MSRLPPIPPEQRSFTGEQPRDRLRSAEPDRRDEATATRRAKPGDAEVNLELERSNP